MGLLITTSLTSVERRKGRIARTVVTQVCKCNSLDEVMLLPSARMHTVVGSVCVCVCVSVTLHLASRVFVRLTNLTGNECQKVQTVFSENAPLQS